MKLVVVTIASISIRYFGLVEKQSTEALDVVILRTEPPQAMSCYYLVQRSTQIFLALYSKPPLTIVIVV